MNIIFGPVPDGILQKYTVLELDTFYLSESGCTKTAYCVVENILLSELFMLSNLISIHADLMQAYRDQNWQYCKDAITDLTGRWNGELDSFYSNLMDRVFDHETNPVGSNWTGVLVRSQIVEDV